MAAPTPAEDAGPSPSFLFEIYNDGQPLRHHALALAQPNGPCHYTDQSLPRCGCRRFWSRQSAPGSPYQAHPPANADLAHTCMCSHHACFHEDVQSQTALGQVTAPVPPVHGGDGVDQENERPRAHREPLSPVQDLAPFQIPAASLGASLDLGFLNFEASGLAQQLDAVQPPSSMPDTLSWGGGAGGAFVGPQAADTEPGDFLQPIPSQCLLSNSTRPPSTASSSQSRFLRPFGGRGLDTLTPRASRHEQSPAGHADKGEVAMAAAAAPVSQAEGQNALLRLPHVSAESFLDLSNTVHSHEQRLERLENTSFSVAGHEDCQDKMDHTDLRVTELESRVEQVESLLNDNSSVGSARRSRMDDDAAASVLSLATNATAPLSGHSTSELYTQVQALQAQVNQLQSVSLPTYNKPWQLELVFLPFPLTGIWMDARDFPSQRRSGAAGNNAEEWTQMPNTVGRATPDPQSPPHYGEWVDHSSRSDWLFPRAFVNGRVIDQRLRSRGLIQTVAIRGPDARSVQLAVNKALEHVLRASASMSSRDMPRSADPRLAEFLGLRQAWVPLRKLHKDARLRFLAPAEMATPALWDYSFLSSSVVMKASGLQRLYVTQPEAYLQDHPLGHHALVSGWTWPKVRALSTVFANPQHGGGGGGGSSSSSNGESPGADPEECWSQNDKLDEEPPTAKPSALSLRPSHYHKLSRRSSTSTSQSFHTVPSPTLATGRAQRAQSPAMLRDRKSSRPPHIRTASLPLLQSLAPSPAQARRRITSHNANQPSERRPSPLVTRHISSRASANMNTALTPLALASVSKRRQSTNSPVLIPRNTPRYSRPSMSRSPSLAPPGPLGLYNNRSERRTTPFCYATPYSNAPPEHPHHLPPANSRGRILGPGNGYDPEDEMDMDMDGEEDDDRGSSTDAYDSDATHDAPRAAGFSSREGQGRASNSVGADIDVYEDSDGDPDATEDAADHDGDDEGSTAWRGGHGFGFGQADAHLRPEDVPWQGIEDPMSDGETCGPDLSQEIAIHEDADADVDSGMTDSFAEADADVEFEIEAPEDDDDDDDDANGSDASSVPSEYPSTHRAWHVSSAAAMSVDPEESSPAPASVGHGPPPPPPSPPPPPPPPPPPLCHQSSLGGAGGGSMGFRIHEDSQEGEEGSGFGPRYGAARASASQW